MRNNAPDDSLSRPHRVLTISLVLFGFLSVAMADQSITPSGGEKEANGAAEDTEVVPTKKDASEVVENAEPVPKKPFIPDGSAACLVEQADIDLFIKGKDIGHVGDNPKNSYRRLVQRTIMITEPLSPCGAVLTFDDQIITKQEDHADAMEIAKGLQKEGVRAIFFANMPEMSAKELWSIMRSRRSDKAKLLRVQELLDSKRATFIKAIRELLKLKSPKDKDGNQYYICEVFNHTAFHQDMSNMKVRSFKFEACLLGIEYIEECIDEAYRLERPDYQRARYFRFPFLHAPKHAETKRVLNEKFTELGLISLGETQDSKDVDNFSSKKAYASLAAAMKNRRYSVKTGAYGRTDKPIALFHTRTWRKIRKGVLQAIKEGKAKPKTNELEKPEPQK